MTRSSLKANDLTDCFSNIVNSFSVVLQILLLLTLSCAAYHPLIEYDHFWGISLENSNTLKPCPKVGGGAVVQLNKFESVFYFFLFLFWMCSLTPYSFTVLSSCINCIMNSRLNTSELRKTGLRFENKCLHSSFLLYNWMDIFAFQSDSM